MNVKGGLFGGENQWEERGQKERMMKSEWDQSILYECMKIE
jgi:hypothetical protein